MSVHTPVDPKPTPSRRAKGALAVSIGTIVVGGCVIVGTLLSTGFTAVRDLSAMSLGAPVQQNDVAGIRDLDVDVAGGALRIVYDDVSEAELDGGGVGAWTLERRGDTLHVSSPRRSFADWGSGSQATLTLPRELGRQDLGLHVEVAGGSIDLSGDSADLTGGAPARTRVDVTAGSADIGLPDATYRLSSEGPGSIDSSLQTSPTATPRVEVQATLGSVTLRTT